VTVSVSLRVRVLSSLLWRTKFNNSFLSLHPPQFLPVHNQYHTSFNNILTSTTLANTFQTQTTASLRPSVIALVALRLAPYPFTYSWRKTQLSLCMLVGGAGLHLPLRSSCPMILEGDSQKKEQRGHQTSPLDRLLTETCRNFLYSPPLIMLGPNMACHVCTV